jgi:hypothetical protein
MRSFLAVAVAGMTAISATLLERQCVSLSCDFEGSDCDITLDPGQSACCGNGQALHCFADGTQYIETCQGTTTCLLYIADGESIRDCRCGS